MKKWFDSLDEHDQLLVKRMVLSSGSLKAVAKTFGITYPTLRLRLDRLIDRVKLLDRTEGDSVERLLALRHSEGRLDRQTYHQLLEAHRHELSNMRFRTPEPMPAPEPEEPESNER